MLGYENYYYLHESISAYADYFDIDNFPYLSLGNKDYASNSGSAYENAYRSLFGRIMYNYDDRYLLQVNMRRDGSSRFHSDYRWGNFPSVSAGWVISQEQFMKDVNPNILSFLKLRASWGRLGNERIGSNYPYVSLMSFTNTVFYDDATTTESTAYKTAAQYAYAIKNISWETTESFDIGVDARLFDGRLSFTGDFYRKTTKDMLLALAIPKYLGYDDPDQNAGKMNTTGYDLEVSWNDHIGDLTYGVNFNLSDYVSKMGTLNGTTFTSTGKISCEGSYYNEWYGYIADGIFQTEEELANSPKISASTKVGDIKYRDISGPDGVPDGKISEEYDRVLLGNSLPRYLFGGGINLGWKGIDFSIAFQGVGKQNARLTETMVQPLKSNWGAIPAIIDGSYWSTLNTDEQNEAARYPRLTYTNKDLNNAMSTFWLFNGAYFRMKNITLGYTLPQKWTRQAYINSLRIYVSGNDLFTFNHYPTGFDPERTATAYPLTRSVMFGLNVNF
jgi:TonB-linked SusC/RagA family outer membrane protein